MTFDVIYNAKQREAIFELKLRGLSGAEVSRLCARGTHGLEPFDIPRDTVNRIAREEEANRLGADRVADMPVGEAERLVRRSLGLLDKWLGRIASRQARGKDIGSDFIECLTALEKVQRLATRLPGKSSGNGHGALSGGFLADLADEDSGNEATAR